MKRITIASLLLTAFFMLTSCSATAPTSVKTIQVSTQTPFPTKVPPTATPTWAVPEIPVITDGNTTITVLPKESDNILINPGKGWVLYFPFTVGTDEMWDVVSVCYTRISWAWLEPAEGDFQWSVLDDAVQICAKHGKRFAFGVMAANTDSAPEFVTPEWVYNSGAKSALFPSSNGLQVQVPVWNDPVYLEKMQKLINALEKHYDGDPNIAYIDARNCGMWGEWHDLGCSELSDKDKKALIDQWSVFKHTAIIVPTNFDLAEVQARYGVDTYGFGIRSDSSELRVNAAGYAFDKGPAVSEWGNGYAAIKTCEGWTKVCWSSDLFLDYMNRSKFSYDNLGQWGTDDSLAFYQDNTAVVKEWANRMGYWFKLTKATYPVDLGNGSTGTLSFDVRNDGVAPIYVNYNTTYVRLALLDASGVVLNVSDPLAGVNPYAWKPGQVTTVTAQFTFPQTQNAAYLAIGLFSSSESTKPDILLGNQGVLPNNWLPIHGELQP